MYRRVLAFDFDGTLADNGIIPLALQRSSYTPLAMPCLW